MEVGGDERALGGRDDAYLVAEVQVEDPNGTAQTRARSSLRRRPSSPSQRMSLSASGSSGTRSCSRRPQRRAARQIRRTSTHQPYWDAPQTPPHTKASDFSENCLSEREHLRETALDHNRALACTRHGQRPWRSDTSPMGDEQVVVVSYDPDWPRQFEAERVLLERVLAPWLQGGIHHIGSTAIAGIAAKPIIDIMAGVRDLEEARAAFDPLHQHSYLPDPHRPRVAHHFAKPSLQRPTHGLHLTQPGSDLWHERLAFRDALRNAPTLAARVRDAEAPARRRAPARGSA